MTASTLVKNTKYPVCLKVSCFFQSFSNFQMSCFVFSETSGTISQRLCQICFEINVSVVVHSRSSPVRWRTRISWIVICQWQRFLCGECSISSYDRLVQDCSNSSVLATELLQSFTKPSRCEQQQWYTIPWRTDSHRPVFGVRVRHRPLCLTQKMPHFGPVWFINVYFPCTYSRI